MVHKYVLQLGCSHCSILDTILSHGVHCTVQCTPCNIVGCSGESKLRKRQAKKEKEAYLWKVEHSPLPHTACPSTMQEQKLGLDSTGSISRYSPEQSVGFFARTAHSKPPRSKSHPPPFNPLTS